MTAGLKGQPRGLVGTWPATVVNGPAPQQARATRALLIGINYTGSDAELKGCQNDAKDMYELITTSPLFGYSPQNVRMMIDRAGAEQPTRANILAGFRWLVEGATPGDCLFLHYSGHGGQEEDPSCTEEDCMDETILPVDFESQGQIIDNDLFEVLIRPLQSGVKMTVVFDCCHSGTGLDLPFTYQQPSGMMWGGGGGLAGQQWACDDNPCHSEGDVKLFSGCRDAQTSADIQELYSKPRGAMTEAIIETLRQNSRHTYASFMEGLHRHLDQGGHDQRPMLTSSQAFDLNQPFQAVGGICPNQNPVIGRQFNKRKKPRMQWAEGDPLQNMLAGAVVAEAIGAVLGSGGGFIGGMLADQMGGGGFGQMGGGGFGQMGGGYGQMGGGGFAQMGSGYGNGYDNNNYNNVPTDGGYDDGGDGGGGFLGGLGGLLGGDGGDDDYDD